MHGHGVILNGSLAQRLSVAIQTRVVALESSVLGHEAGLFSKFEWHRRHALEDRMFDKTNNCQGYTALLRK
jgi:hypothetical protein